MGIGVHPVAEQSHDHEHGAARKGDGKTKGGVLATIVARETRTKELRHRDDRTSRDRYGPAAERERRGPFPKNTTQATRGPDDEEDSSA